VDGEWPLAMACVKGDDKSAELLLNHRADAERASHTGHTLLGMAIHSKSIRCVQLLLAYGADPNRVDSCRQMTPLGLSCLIDDPKITEILLEHGADPNKGSDIGSVPLIMAIEKRQNDLKTVEMLLNHGADPTRVDEHGTSVLLESARSSKLRILELLLIPRHRPATVLVLCCIREYTKESLLNDDYFPLDMFKEILKAARMVPDVNLKNAYGNFPLYASVRSESVEMVKLLLENGADPNQSSDGKTALDEATRRRNAEIIQLLIENAANPGHVDPSPKTNDVLRIRAVSCSKSLHSWAINDPDAHYSRKCPFYPGN
jgi:ankyrin repeat protein